MLWEYYNNHMECESKGSINTQTLISIHKYFFFLALENKTLRLNRLKTKKHQNLMTFRAVKLLKCAWRDKLQPSAMLHH